MPEDLRGKRLLVLGGTRISCEIIRKAKQMGLTVAVADYFPREKSPGKLIADEDYEVSVIDVDAVSALIKRVGFDGVLTGFSDMLLPYYADICNRTGLPSYGTKEQFETFIDKAKYKALCRKFGVPTVEEYRVDGDFVDDSSIRYPVLVKPADSSGARGITVCGNKTELLAAIEKARSASKTKTVLVERYLTGREVTVFWLFIDGEYYLTAIGNRHVKHNQGDDIIPLPVGYTYPASITPRYRAEIEEKAKDMFRYAGIQNGMMFMQCKVEDGICVVYDVGYRLTGSLEYINLEAACGYNPLEMMIHFAVTGKMVDKDVTPLILPETMKPSFNVSCLSAPGTIAKIDGLERVKTLPTVADAVPAYVPGETITKEMRGLLAQIAVRILGSTERKEQLYEAMHEVEETIRILSPEGKELRLPGIAPEDIEGLVL